MPPGTKARDGSRRRRQRYDTGPEHTTRTHNQRCEAQQLQSASKCFNLSPTFCARCYNSLTIERSYTCMKSKAEGARTASALLLYGNIL